MSAYQSVFLNVRQKIFEAIDAEVANNVTTEQLKIQLAQAVNGVILQEGWAATEQQKVEFVDSLVDELHGFGPLQGLMDDEDISDIMINGPDNIFVEKAGKLQKTDVNFVDGYQLLNIAKRIAAEVGRRVDDSSPTCDARMSDGSRINIVIPPVAIDGTSMSIRKFKNSRMDLDKLTGFGAMSPQMALILKIAARCRLNILVSGGTGSGKTTMLNALSQYVSHQERIVTIEDAAELNLQQPHVVRLETKVSGLEGDGGVDTRDLVINSLRMRPDRIVVGECRGGEAFEMLQAMNTGHDGSMSTLHANSPRDAIARVESMVMMATSNLPLSAIKRTIVSAVDLIVQVNRLHDGSRKVMSITEVVGIEGDNVTLEEIYRFKLSGNSSAGEVQGDFVTDGLMQSSVLVEKASFFGLDNQLTQAFHEGAL
ncbi:CpaF family protein [Vibrio sp. SCSIO 43135]|uniref:CpaF family protein n=1 Tax=Vibrio sp. SCSIO 43135 TaxID=2819096 RepID=UPI002075BF85|nr:CpaF family protein [Vibrio sp. SCSIO 43135]USD40102.1 CpaF family protein [Vibrio sp. SCSIO 43135]